MKDFSRSTQVYILGIIILAGLITTWQFYQTPLEVSWLLLLACVVASFLQGIAVFGTTARSTYSLSWIVYAFTLVSLGPAATIITVFISHVAEWLLDKDRLKWYIQSFNISIFVIGFSLAHLIIVWGQTTFATNDTIVFLITLISLVVFTFVNHLLVALVVRLARGQRISESGIFGWFTLLLDFTLLCLGFNATIIWQANPISLLLVAFIAYILFQALNIPALERKAEIDAKTELFNARYFTQALDEEMVRAKRFKRPLSLIMADLDFLRNINNTYGHLAGDVVLQGIAHILQEMTREYDIVARFGGEEFSVMLPETESEDAYLVAERIRQRIEATEFAVSTSVEPIRATMSFGIARLDGNKQTIDNLIHNADLALYQAKETGRNRVCVYDHQISDNQETTRDWAKLGLSVKATANPTPPLSTYKNGRQPENLAVATEPVLDSFPEPVTAPLITSIDSPQPASATPQRQFPGWAANAYIALLACTAFGFAFLQISVTDWQVDLAGLLLFAVFVLLVEGAAIEIYIRDSSVSTSAVLLVAGVFLFGGPGAVILGIAIAFVAYAKRRTAISRFVFNASNHTIGGLLIAYLLQLNQVPIENWTLLRLLIIGVGAASLIYLTTTLFLTIAVGLSNGQSFRVIWNERFRWLAPYYLSLGIIAAALVFSYLAIDLAGLFIIILPLLLLRYSQKQYIDQTETLVHDLKKTNAQLLEKSEEVTLLNEELLLTLARSLDLRDPHVVEHSKHVSRYAVCMAEESGLPAEQVESIRKAGLLHDIGKLGVREEILFKPGRLTADEFEMVKEHVTIGADLVQGCHSLEPLVPFVLHHHEWFDGRGYPHGLAGDEIPLEARILSVADAVEAMASDRPYKQAMSPAAILAEIQRCTGTQFDPVVARAFSRVIQRQGEGIIVNSARDVLARQMNDAKTYAPHY